MIEINNTADKRPEKRRRCYIQARSFFFAAKRCGRIEICEESDIPQGLPIPEYVNIAFSCELYLKTLLYQDEEIIKEHRLSSLFRKLDATLRRKVAEILEMKDTEIEEFLDKHLNLFTEMRYRFESPQYSESYSIPLQLFYSLAISLDQLAQETIGVVPYPWTGSTIDITNEELLMMPYF